MKKVLKFKFQETEGFLSVSEQADCYYALVKKDTPKVASIKKSKTLLISYDLKEKNYQAVDVAVSYDQALISKTYHQLKADNNVYFENLDDSLCVIEIPKKS